jgi:hypothetical protein
MFLDNFMIYFERTVVVPKKVIVLACQLLSVSNSYKTPIQMAKFYIF